MPQAAGAHGTHICVNCRRLENDVEALRNEVAKIQAEKASSDERAKDDLTMSREVISLLLRRLNGFLANPAGGQVRIHPSKLGPQHCTAVKVPVC